MIEKKPYVRVNLPLTPKESSDLLSLSFNEEIKERMEKTIEVEAPIRRTLLYKRVINSFGLLKVGSRLLSLFDSISSELSKSALYNATFFTANGYRLVISNVTFLSSVLGISALFY